MVVGLLRQTVSKGRDVRRSRRETAVGDSGRRDRESEVSSPIAADRFRYPGSMRSKYHTPLVQMWSTLLLGQPGKQKG